MFFYKVFLELAGPGVMATLEFYQGNGGMETINKSHLFFLPKCQGAVRVGEFRHISLSNSIYLIIAKLLANRLHEMIDEFVRPFQFAFILERQLVDSAVVAGEKVASWEEKAPRVS